MFQLVRVACVASVLLALTGASAPAATPTVVRVLVVKGTWGPQPEPDIGAISQAAAAFFAHASFGTVQLTFTETPWLTAYTNREVCFDPQQIADQGDAAAAEYAPAGFDRIVYVTACVLAQASASEALHRVILGQNGLSAPVLEHELGHTFGMSHAGALECARSRCTIDPYGNPLDVMGLGVGDPGALQKAEAGWPVNTETVTVPGTYTLAAIELPSTLPQALVIRRGAVDLWIEHRDAVGNDAYLKTSIWRPATAGVLVHEAPANSPTIPLMQRRPDFLLGNGGPNGLFIVKGKTFTVPHVMAIDVLGHVGTTITVRLRKLS